MCFLLENTEKSLCQKEWEEKLLLVRVPVPGRQRGGGRASGSPARAGSAEAGVLLHPPRPWWQGRSLVVTLPGLVASEAEMQIGVEGDWRFLQG